MVDARGLLCPMPVVMVQKAVKDGKMAATVAQKPDKMGETAIGTAVKIMAGETVEKSIPVEVELIK